MKTTIYANYDVLGADKCIVYSVARADIYDELVVDVPDDLFAGYTSYGAVLINAAGGTYLLDELLYSYEDKPYIRFWSPDGESLHELTVINRIEH